MKTSKAGALLTAAITLCACGKTPKTISVTAVGIYDDEIVLTEGEACEPRYWIEPYDATDKSVSWTSADPEIASITKKGRMHAEHAGTTTITVRTDDGGRTASSRVVVLKRAIHVSSIYLDTKSAELAEGDALALSVTISPVNADDPAVSWSSSDPDIAAVDNDGLVCARSAGTATITATANDGGASATCLVTVRKYGTNEDFNHRDFNWD